MAAERAGAELRQSTRVRRIKRLEDGAVTLVTAGMLTVVMCQEGWLFIIPLDEETTRFGLVMEEQAYRKTGVAARKMLSWAIRRCPVMAQRCSHAEPGYFLLGDAATFVDPIFSMGVCLGMMSGRKAAESAAKNLLEGARSRPQRRRYRRFVEDSSAVFFRLVRAFYTREFRDLFLSQEGPLEVHKAVIGVLAGNVFPRPAWELRWREAKGPISQS